MKTWNITLRLVEYSYQENEVQAETKEQAIKLALARIDDYHWKRTETVGIHCLRCEECNED